MLLAMLHPQFIVLTVREPVMLFASQALDRERTGSGLLLQLLAEHADNGVDPVPLIAMCVRGHALGTVRGAVGRNVQRVFGATQCAERRALFVVLRGGRGQVVRGHLPESEVEAGPIEQLAIVQ